jgi:long-chain-fatty-acyl-CoA reductase
VSDIKLPIIVNGELVWETDAAPHVIEYETGFTATIPRLTEAEVERINAVDRNALAGLHLDELTVFLSRVGKLWGAPDYAGRIEALRDAENITGYHSSILASDYKRIARACDRSKLYDIVETDLGDPLLLDDWIPRQSVYLKAIPRGRVLHLMVGNVPLAGLYTIVRGVVTKNLTVAKLPKRDLVSTLAFARTFLDIDPDHPVTKSISVAYWPGGDDIENTFINNADVICAWGKRASIEAVKPKVPIGVELVEFGPKESIMLVDAGAEDIREVAARAAYDLSVYDQEACFSPQRMFVRGEVNALVDALAEALDQAAERLPAGHVGFDKAAHITRARQEAKFHGCKVRHSEGSEWTVVAVPPGLDMEIAHPLARTIYLYQVDDLHEAVAEVHRDTQTVSVSPWARGLELADDLVRAGASRVTEIGLMSRPRPGFAHDAMKPLNSLVRWVVVERGLDYRGRFRDASRDEFVDTYFPVNG